MIPEGARPQSALGMMQNLIFGVVKDTEKIG
jgi:hypothetical protein